MLLNADRQNKQQLNAKQSLLHKINDKQAEANWSASNSIYLKASVVCSHLILNHMLAVDMHRLEQGVSFDHPRGRPAAQQSCSSQTIIMIQTPSHILKNNHNISPSKTHFKTTPISVSHPANILLQLSFKSMKSIDL